MSIECNLKCHVFQFSLNLVVVVLKYFCFLFLFFLYYFGHSLLGDVFDLWYLTKTIENPHFGLNCKYANCIFHKIKSFRKVETFKL